MRHVLGLDALLLDPGSERLEEVEERLAARPGQAAGTSWSSRCAQET
jgi:hypothetical protein